MRLRCAAVGLQLLCLASFAAAQGLPPSWRSTAKTAAYIELGGSAGLYSLNLDRRLNSRFTFRAAMAQYTSIEFGDQPNRDIMRLAFMLNALVGGPSNWLELGLGPMGGRYAYQMPASPDIGFASITSALGYRHQTRTEGFVFRAGVAPQYQFGSKRDRGGLSVWPGLSVGISF